MPQVVEAIFFGFAGEVAQVGLKVGDQRRECPEAGIGILAVMNSEKIIRCFPGGSGDRSIGYWPPSFSPVLE